MKNRGILLQTLSSYLAAFPHNNQLYLCNFDITQELIDRLNTSIANNKINWLTLRNCKFDNNIGTELSRLRLNNLMKLAIRTQQMTNSSVK